MKLSTLLFTSIAFAALGVDAADSRSILRSAVERNTVSKRSHGDIVRRQATSQCANACASPGDAAAAAGLESCDGSDLVCICGYLSQITANCLSCVATAEQITLGELQSGCAAATMSAPLDSVTITGGSTISMTPTRTESSSAASATSTQSSCQSLCSSASDRAIGQEISQCDDDDTACICEASNRLSSACLTCILQIEDLTAADFQAVCAEASGSSSSSSTTATNTGVVPPISSAATRISSLASSATRTSSGSSSSHSSSTARTSSSSTTPSATSARGAALTNAAPVGLMGGVAVLLGVVMA